MTLEQALSEYRRIKASEGVSQALSVTSDTTGLDVLNLFKRIDQVLPMIMNESTADWFTACLLFSEMSMRKIGGDRVSLLSYYYGTLAISQHNLSENSHIDARRLRLFALFLNLNAFDRLIAVAQTPMCDYEGSLTNNEFLDFLIMSDTYLVWDSDTRSNLLSSIKRLTTQHESNYPNYSRNIIISEGRKAHDALFAAVSMAVAPKPLF